VVDEEQIRKLEAQLRDLEVQRSKKMEQFLALKRSRETLEKLREEARQRFLHEQLQIEQKQLDEASQIAYARKKLRRHASGAA
jgi:flagellar biosynthesis chaperone FliJ